jgi:hypothetical protein
MLLGEPVSNISKDLSVPAVPSQGSLFSALEEALVDPKGPKP